MRLLGRVLIAVVFVFIAANSGVAGIVNNSGSLGADSLSLRLALLDTLGQPTKIDTTVDWGYLMVFYPGGDSCYSDSFLIAQTDAHIEIWTSAIFTDTWFTYKEAVSAIDGAGLNGRYTWHVALRDSSLKLTTPYWGEFDLVTQGDFASILDSAAYGAGATDSVTVDKSNAADLVLTRSQPDSVRAEIAQTVGDTVRDVVGDTFNVSSGSVHVAGLADTIRDVIGDTLNATSGKVYVALVDGLGDTLRDVVGDTFNVVSGKVPVTFVDGLGDTIRDVVGDTFNVISGGVLLAARGSDADTGIAGIKTKVQAIKAITDQITFSGTTGYIMSNVADWGDGTLTIQSVGGLPAVNTSTVSTNAVAPGDISTDAITSATIAGSAAREIADSNWKAGVKGMQTGDADSTFADAFINTGGQAYAIVDFDTSGGTIANSQVDDDVDVNVKTASTGAIEDQDADVITVNIKDPDTIAVALSAAATVAGFADTMRDVLGDTLNATNGKVYVALVDGLADTVRDVLGDTVNAISGILLTDAGDSIRAHAPHGNNFASTATTTCNGDGIVSCTLDVRNTAGGLAGVDVGIYNTSNAFLYGDESNNNGFVYFNLDASTTYRVKAGGLPGSVHDSLPYQTLVTTSATNIRDTVPMTTHGIPSPAAVNLKRVYDDIYDVTGNPVEGADVIVEIIMPDSTIVPYDTSSSASVGKKPNPVTAKTDSNGRFTIDLIPNDYIRPAGSRYRISLVYLGKIIYSVTIRANGTTTALVRSLQ